jgi:hypothetical protein
MRAQHYRFAHQVLMADVLSDPEGSWTRLSTDGAAVLSKTWQRAAEGVPESEQIAEAGLRAATVPSPWGSQSILVTLPPPAEPTECHQVALVRGPDGKVRYFVMEQGLEKTPGTPRAYWAEWRLSPGGGQMRIRGEDLRAVDAGAFFEAIAGELVGRTGDEEDAPTQVQPSTPKSARQLARPGASSRLPVMVIVGVLVLAAVGWVVWRYLVH